MAGNVNHLIGSVAAGLITAIAWWFLIDSAVYSSTLAVPYTLQWYEYIPAVSITVFLFMINLVSLDHLLPNESEIFIQNNNRPLMIKIWLFLWFTMSFGAIGGGITIMAVKYTNSYLGWTVLAQPIVVFIAAILWLFMRRTPPQEDSLGMM